MTERAAITCDYPNCPTAIPAGTRYCAAHVKPPEKQQASGKPWWSKWYHRVHWRNLRTLVLARDPVCKICNHAASTVADHIVPHKGNWALFCDMKNLWGLCKSCHDKKTAAEDGGFGTPPDNKRPVTTGETGQQFSSGSVSEVALNRALAEE